VPEEKDENDNRYWHSEEPKQYSAAHGEFPFFQARPNNASDNSEFHRAGLGRVGLTGSRTAVAYCRSSRFCNFLPGVGVVSFGHFLGGISVTLILIIIVLVLLFGGGGYYGYNRGYYGGGGHTLLWLVLVVIVVVLLFGHSGHPVV
jgi:hypothetical protein